MSKDKQLKIRCSPQEKILIEIKSKELGFNSVSEYARTCLVNGANIEQIEIDMQPCYVYVAKLNETKKAIQWIANRCAGTGSIYFDDVIELRDRLREIELTTQRLLRQIEKEGKYHERNFKDN